MQEDTQTCCVATALTWTENRLRHSSHVEEILFTAAAYRLKANDYQSKITSQPKCGNNGSNKEASDVFKDCTDMNESRRNRVAFPLFYQLLATADEPHLHLFQLNCYLGKDTQFTPCKTTWI